MRCSPAGWSRSVTAQLRDQYGSNYSVAGLSMADPLSPGTPNDLGVSSASYGPFPTNASGQWPDTYFVCSTACPASPGSSSVLQYWTHNSIAMQHVNAVVYKCTSITIDGY